MAKLNETKAPKPFHYDIHKTISVDTQLLNFGTFLPEKLLGSILLISNQTDEDQVVELTIDTKTQIYDTEKIINENKEFTYLTELLQEHQKAFEKKEPTNKEDLVEYEKFLEKKAKKL